MEKKAWRVNFEDGIFDIYFGIIIISFVPHLIFIEILPIPINFLLGPIIIGFALAFFILCKKYLIKPRIGTVKYGRKRKIRKMKTAIILSINVIALLILFLLRISDFWDNLNIPNSVEILLIQLIFVTLPLCLVAYILQYHRLYIIAVLMGSSFFFAELISNFITPPINILFVFLIIGGLIILMGVFSMIKFTKKYPLEKEGLD